MRLGILIISMMVFASIYIGCSRFTIQNSDTYSSYIVQGWIDSANPQLETRLTFDLVNPFDLVNHVTKEESGIEAVFYEYLRDSVIIKEFNKEESRFVYEFRGRLDSRGRLISGTATSSYVSTTPDTVQHFFEYNEDGFLSKETRLTNFTDSFVIKNEYDGKNLKQQLTYSGGVLYNTKDFEYYSHLLNPGLPEGFKFRNNLNNLVGRSGESLIKKITSIGKNSKKKYIQTYEYQNAGEGYTYTAIGKKNKKINSTTTYFYTPANHSSIGSLTALDLH